ncbi:hypothetical protein T484DRAFT_1883539 [Baffinella frigidus]|nr:hypothetical protein T484DRAFT_1883539 [Cryptophyta sp. CCMP2293]
MVLCGPFSRGHVEGPGFGLAKPLWVLLVFCFLQVGGNVRVETAPDFNAARSIATEIFPLGMLAPNRGRRAPPPSPPFLSQNCHPPQRGALAVPLSHTIGAEERESPIQEIPAVEEVSKEGQDSKEGQENQTGKAGAYQEGVSKWKPCERANCKKQATYGDSWKGSAKLCAEHRLTPQIDLNRKRCRHIEGCEKYAIYGHPPNSNRSNSPGQPASVSRASAGGTRRAREARKGGAIYYGEAILCSGHRAKGMISIYGHRCLAVGCLTQACFGPRGSRSVSHCATHRLASEEDVRHRQCHVAGCDKRAYYAVPQAGKALRPSSCGAHRTEGEVDVTSKRCEHRAPPTDPGDVTQGVSAKAAKRSGRAGLCFIQPTYGDIKERKKRYCSTHRRKGDVLIRQQQKRRRLTSGHNATLEEVDLEGADDPRAAAILLAVAPLFAGPKTG